MTGRRLRTTRATTLVAACALVLASCGGGNESDTETEETPSPSVSPSPSSTVTVPDEVELTEVGADLGYGETATVIYEPNQTSGTVLEVTVDRVTRGTTKDFSGFILDDYTKSATPFYADVSVHNVGEGNVGAAAVPLWGVDGQNTLLPAASFTVPFQRCPSEPLPKKFPPGADFETCLVLLAPDNGTLEGVSFRPNQDFDPITWTGEVAAPEREAKKQKGSKKGKKKRNRG